MREDKILKKLMRREYISDVRHRFLEKDKSLDESAFEEVFDKLTLFTIYELMNKGIIDDFYGVVSAGKESRIYNAKSKEGEELAVKIYLVNNAEFRRSRNVYVLNDPRFRRVPSQLREFIYLWARREFTNLQTAYRVGIPVPKPVFVSRNVLVMGFLGKNGERYPLLREIEIEPEKALIIYEKIIKYIDKLYKNAKLIHGDLSEYNIVVADTDEIYFIDLSQAIHISHPMANEFLKRDIKNVNRYFLSIGIEPIDDETLISMIMEENHE
ncbi:MAG: serine protein kinase RIO [Nitrososphaerota archaeon]